jgi:hypothetical protein
VIGEADDYAADILWMLKSCRPLRKNNGLPKRCFVQAGWNEISCGGLLGKTTHFPRRKEKRWVKILKITAGKTLFLRRQ